ncbi:hypothetical protein FRC00_010457 [Tulasnella sp. 408]|nr:hypothetical protein FRC00_010457 [Tulasnella sp. 408]
MEWIKGPTIAYLAKVPDATQESVTGLRWFKIQEDGFDGTTWGVQRMIAAKGLHTIKIPSCIPPGNYFLRAEVIALHAASSYPGAQLYMECAQINITGGGSANPATVSFPGAYKGTDPGIKYNLYNGSKTYTIPGPAVFTCTDQSDFGPDYYIANHYQHNDKDSTDRYDDDDDDDDGGWWIREPLCAGKAIPARLSANHPIPASTAINGTANAYEGPILFQQSPSAPSPREV